MVSDGIDSNNAYLEKNNNFDKNSQDIPKLEIILRALNNIGKSSSDLLDTTSGIIKKTADSIKSGGIHLLDSMYKQHLIPI